MKQLELDLQALCVLRDTLNFEPMKRLLDLLAALRAGTPQEQAAAVGAYASSLLPYGMDLRDALLAHLKGSRNRCAESISREESSGNLTTMLREELAVLSRAADLSPEDVRPALSDPGGYMPTWIVSDTDLAAEYLAYLDSAPSEGFGLYRDHIMFTLGRRHIQPVLHPDPITLADLHGYGRQRDIILRNTHLLLEGGTASNVLLYGDSGTGKSTTVKAVANELGNRGLRLVEVRKSQIRRIPRLLDELAQEPLKFIVFIDDLSFTDEDDDFGSLKAILEGSVQARANNVVIYATSNRRRLVKETFSERGADDIHANETVQQKAALSDRFGIALPFMNPKKDEYLQMVKKLAGGTDLPEEELFAGAEQYALEKGGRSGRVAKQYVEQLPLRR